VITDPMLRHSKRVAMMMELWRLAKVKETSWLGPYTTINHEIYSCWSAMQ
jgi:hypothetical protein